MGNQPHVHSTEEVKANISRIEHNASGPGEPSGKRSGPPTGAEGGSTGNKTTKTPGVTTSEKGGDWVSKRKA